MDVVWIKLTIFNEIPQREEEYFMFGPTGIIRFKRVGELTQLMTQNKVVVAKVTEEPEYIMDVLRKIRGTNGKVK